MSVPLFHLDNISFSVQGRNLLDHINLDIRESSFILIKGPSGAGKTTLLRLFNGLDNPTLGNILYKGNSILNGNMTHFRQDVGMVFQNPTVFMGSVRENLLLRKRWDKSFRPNDNQISKSLNEVGLAKDQLELDARSLSGGEKQRLALARVLLNKPTTLLLDEPTANLDEELGKQILKQVSGLKDDLGLTIVLVSHQANSIGGKIDQQIHLKAGKIVSNS